MSEKRMSLRRPLWVGGIGMSLCIFTWLGWGTYLYWNDVKLVNFLAAWIPFVLSILLAFVPEHKMTRAKKIAWRSSVIGVGFLWSVVLWHQQVIADETTRRDQNRIVNEAVAKSNEHSDERISKVRDDVKGVKTDVKEVQNDLGEKTKEIRTLVAKSEFDINSSIEKVNKPDPPELAQLQFSLFGDNFGTNPILSTKIKPDKDGSYPVDVVFTNISGVSADTIDVWVYICDFCSFSVEPSGFDNPNGSDEHSRHKIIPLLNSGTTFEKTTLHVKVSEVAQRDSSFKIGFKYSCKTCGKMPAMQTLTVLKLP